MGYQDFDQELHSQSMIREDINFKQIENALAYNKDVEYMKQMLPSTLQVIQRAVDDECDQLEYSGSVMFDEYPDKTHLRMIVDKIMLRLTASDEDEGEVEGTSLDYDAPTKPSYCPDDAMLDCEDEAVSATDLDNAAGAGPVKESWGWGPGRGPGWGPGWEHGRGHGWDHGRGHGWEHGRGHGRGHKPCFGPLCPLSNRRCGHGRWCSPIPFADFDDEGNPNWMRHLVENMLTNEFTYRRSRYRNHNL